MTDPAKLCLFLLQDNMATMHDILDAQWMYDNYKDGEKFFSCFDVNISCEGDIFYGGHSTVHNHKK